MELLEEKIQIIAKEIQEANASQWTITKIIKALSESETKSEKKMRAKALEMLQELDPDAALIYERFSKMKVYTTKETIQGFNRGNIIKSLLKETGISRSVAEKITIEVENAIKDTKISFLTPSLIRELVNAKLIGYGFEEIRNKYTRVGEPIYEVKKKLETLPYSGEQVREYNILLALPEGARELHFDGTIFIEDIEGYSHRPYAYSFIAEKKETLNKTIAATVKTLVENRKYFYQPPNIFGLTFVCAQFTKNKSQAKKIAEQISEMLQIPEQGFALSLELFTPKILEGMNEHRIMAAQISNQLLSKSSVVGVDSKYALKLIEPKGKSFLILNNSEEEYYPLNNGFFSPTQGIDLFVNINLEKIADGKTEQEFFSDLESVANEIKKLKEKKKKLLQEKPYLKEFKPEEMKTAIGLTNLLKLGENFGETKMLEFATKTQKELSLLFDEDLLFGLGSEKVIQRFSEGARKKVFSHETLDFEECLHSKKCCFTGNATTIKDVAELLDKKVKQISFIGKQE